MEGRIELESILKYYRERVDNIQNEREDWYGMIENVKISQEEKHSLEWELHKRKTELAEIQKALSDSHLALFDEREQVLKLRRRNDELKLQEKEDRRRIMELLALTGSVEQDITYFKDSQPNMVKRFPQGVNTAALPKENISLRGNVSKSKTGIMGTSSMSKSMMSGTGFKSKVGTVRDKPKNILRTIYLPNEQINTLQIEVEQLKALNAQQTALFEKQVIALKEDRRIRDEEMRLKFLDYDDKVIKLMETNQRLESLNSSITKDYLDERHKAQQTERRIQEENELLRLESGSLRATMKEAVAKAQKTASVRENELEQKSNTVLAKFRMDSQVKEENLNVIQEQYERIQKIYLAKIEKLEAEIDTKNKKVKDLERRRTLELEGYGRDVDMVKRKIRLYDEYILRLKKLVEDNPQQIMDVANEEAPDLDTAPMKRQVKKLEKDLTKMKARKPIKEKK